MIKNPKKCFFFLGVIIAILKFIVIVNCIYELKFNVLKELEEYIESDIVEIGIRKSIFELCLKILKMIVNILRMWCVFNTDTIDRLFGEIKPTRGVKYRIHLIIYAYLSEIIKTLNFTKTENIGLFKIEENIVYLNIIVFFLNFIFKTLYSVFTLGMSAILLSYKGSLFVLIIGYLTLICVNLDIHTHALFKDDFSYEIEFIDDCTVKNTIVNLSSECEYDIAKVRFFNNYENKYWNKKLIFSQGSFENSRIYINEDFFSQISKSRMIVKFLREVGRLRTNTTLNILYIDILSKIISIVVFMIIYGPWDRVRTVLEVDDSAVKKYLCSICISEILQFFCTILIKSVNYKSVFDLDRFIIKMGYGNELIKEIVIESKEKKLSVFGSTLYSKILYYYPSIIERIREIKKHLNKLD